MLNKNDPLIGAVQEVMKRNHAEREAVKLVNEKFGVTDRKALPHERQGEWDAAYKSVLTEGLHPNQQKLDVHEPDKDELTSDDFRKLRAMKANKKPVSEASFPGAPSVKMPKGMKPSSKHEKAYNDHHRELKSLADSGKINTPAGKKQASQLIDKIQGLVDKHLSGSPVPSKKIWIDEQMKDPNARDTTSPSSMGIPKPNYASGTPAYTNKGPQMVNRAAKTSLPAGTVAKSIKEENLEEKAVSKAQHRFFDLVRGIQKGKAKGSAEAEKAAKSMSAKSVRDYAKTSEKGLPEKVSEQVVPLPGAVKPRLEPMQGYGGDVAKRGIAGIRGGRGITAYDSTSAQSRGSQVKSQSTYGDASKVQNSLSDKVKSDGYVGTSMRGGAGVAAYDQSTSKPDAKAQGFKSNVRPGRTIGGGGRTDGNTYRKTPSDVKIKPFGSSGFGPSPFPKYDPEAAKNAGYAGDKRSKSSPERIANPSFVPRPSPGASALAKKASTPGGARPSVVAKNSATGAQASTGKQIGGARPSVVAKNTPTAPKPITPTGNPNMAGSGGNVGAKPATAPKPVAKPATANKAQAPVKKAQAPVNKAKKVVPVRKAAPAIAKPKITPLQKQMARSKTGRDEVAGPRKNAQGLNVSSMTKPSRVK